MKLTSFLLLFSSAFAVKVDQVDTMGGLPAEETLAETEADTLEDTDLYELAETDALAESAMPASFDSTIAAVDAGNQPPFLSCHWDHHHWADRWWSDDGSGRQKWHF